jgi:hypothetical protein
MSDLSYQSLLDRLTEYKKKYYSNLLIRGCIVSLALLLSAYLFVNTLEYLGRFNPWLRGFMFFSFISTLLFCVVYWIVNPLLKLYNINKPISDEEAAVQIGKYFPEISDKLLNTVQLHSLSSSQNELLQASITQRTQQLSLIKFSDAVKYDENRRYLKYAAIPTLLIVLILIFSPQFLMESSARIVNFNKAYVPSAPFSFNLQNASLDVFKNEDFTIYLNMEGKAIPDAVYINYNGRKYKMNSMGNQGFSYTFSKIQKAFDFSFDAAGFNSSLYTIHLITRPSLTQFNAQIAYPEYLNRVDDKLNNVGNLVVPEGSQISWEFFSSEADSLLVYFETDSAYMPAHKKNRNSFEFNKKASTSEPYRLKLKNTFGSNKEDINYFLEVIPDQYPKITVDYFKDTTLFNYIILGGNISDDYGLKKLNLHYKITKAGATPDNKSFTAMPIGIQPKQAIQNFYYQWVLDSLRLLPGDKLEYFVQVWDNDGVNGSKGTRSSSFTFQLPSTKELEKNLDKETEQTKGTMNSTLNEVDKLKKDINNLENRLKTKKNLDFQDKKLIEDILKKKEDLTKKIEEMQKQMGNLNDKKDRFSQNSPQLSEKMQQLQKLMDELLDEETKKLYEELQKLLESNRNNSQELLDKINKKESNLEKEIARALEMFKQIQFDQKLEKEISELNKQAEEQNNLSEETKDKQQDIQQLQNKQEELKQKFEETKQSLEELKEMNKSLEQPSDMQNTSEQEKNIEQEQQKSSEQLQNNQNKKASESQKNAAQQMKDMAAKLAEMQNETEMEQAQENLDHLRDILENLITLSFDQEKLMKDFRNVNLSDPRFVKLSQEQLKLKDDAKIIEDSLYSLAKRVFQIESFVTREVSSMKEHMDESVKGIKNRRLNIATGNQQLAMTSMNNLALLLNDVLKQMQNQMSQAKSGKQQKSKQKNPGLSQLQQQLNEKIQQLQKGGKSGRELSEELAKLAAEQEMIRNALKEMSKGKMKNRDGKDVDGGSMSELMKQMEETEKELVNKNVAPQTVERQKEILTRLLESEKAMRERDEEEKRKAEQAKDKPRNVPSQFADYIKVKEKQIELLKTVPPALSPYYRKEVDEYFKKIE